MDKKLIALLMAQHPDLAEATELALGFAAVVRQQQPDQLDSWLAQADHSNLSPFRRFAKRLGIKKIEQEVSSYYLASLFKVGVLCRLT